MTSLYLPSSCGGIAPASVIATVLAAACFASVVVWAGFGSAIARFLASLRARLAFNGSMAGLLVLSLVPVFV